MIPAPPEGKLRRQPLRARRGMPASVHLLDRRSALAINAALASKRPLLVRGEPGIGKSQLARAAADLLRRSLVTYTVNSRTETDALLWRTDLVARLAEAQIAGSGGDRRRLALRRFVRPGPLWWGLDWDGASDQLDVYHQVIAGTDEPATAPADQLAADAITPPDARSPNGVVVLIDELDKADSAIPNGLLDALGHRGFDVPGVARVSLKDGAPWPLVVFTTNEERHLPEAFLRRCFVLPLSLPKTKDALMTALIERGTAHFGPDRPDKASKQLDAGVIADAAEAIADDRLEHEGDRRYRPGVAEYLDLLGAIQPADDPGALLTEVKEFVLNKQVLRR